ncbi:MAG TPA: hypothetical protein VLH12_09200 [Usitatibacter sp.]|nr:hypothetical protein [Usitatibacter sp.]
MSLPEDVVRYVERSFSQIDRTEALDVLRGAVIEDGSPASARLVRCAVLSAHRDVGRLRKQVAHLKVDWRDIIVEGEYVVRERKLIRVLDLGNPIPEDAT